ncbi:hypothetical protein CONCODRAFT_7044 [Conidiobolus coronatus NRRL 28638]|uniref:Uncharacterized protein n=1 Tax=Conidiobolus coronatus (strain ATCC 28846 / CBS 209.66 / NRRL 28638) TaxID=796925 RepID=A0A137P5Y2_CONC2|nr:hypothetical protein CONCODRAFT_7044 [Conidiobolus coronatus NRRL 28638]|eukprot:KXN70418.1 hypothetical protein CONCODRAFT_7044 [Conidiobolus coronatus NRRL 28638]
MLGNISQLMSLEYPPVINGYRIRSEDAPITQLLNISSDLKLNLNRLEIEVTYIFNFERIVELLSSLENLKCFKINDFASYVIPDKWDRVDILAQNLGKIKEFTIDTRDDGYKSLYVKHIQPDLNVE